MPIDLNKEYILNADSLQYKQQYHGATIRKSKAKKNSPLGKYDGLLEHINLGESPFTKPDNYDKVELNTCKSVSRLYNDYSVNNQLIGMLYLVANHGNFCPYAENCIEICFGVGVNYNNRIDMTNLYDNNKIQFMNNLVLEMLKIVLLAYQNNLKPVFRLNGYSDIKWEDITIVLDNTVKEFILNDLDTNVLSKYININMVKINNGKMTVMTLFDHCDFYDYTKYPAKIRNTGLIQNYHLTYSYDNSSKQQNNGFDIKNILDSGKNVAIIVNKDFKQKLFTTNRYALINLSMLKLGNHSPAYLYDKDMYWVIDGDLYDNRKNDDLFDNTINKGVLVALTIDKVSHESNEAVVHL